MRVSNETKARRRARELGIEIEVHNVGFDSDMAVETWGYKAHMKLPQAAHSEFVYLYEGMTVPQVWAVVLDVLEEYVPCELDCVCRG